MTVVDLDCLENLVKVTAGDLKVTAGDFSFDSSAVTTGELLRDSSMTVVAVDEPDDPAAESFLDLWLCVLELSDLELAFPERRETSADDGEELDIRRTSTMTRTLKKSAASGTTRNINISVVHDQTDQNVDIVDDVNVRTSQRPEAASYAQK